MVITVNNNPFESKYGFKGTNFSVDAEGNIVATSITLTDSSEDTNDLPANFTVRNGTTDFDINDSPNPTLTISRGSRYIFDLSLTNLDFTIYSNQVLYSTGLSHTDGTSGANAQSKSSGRLVFDVPSSAPDTLQYKSTSTATYYTIIVVDEDAAFNNVLINSTTQSNGLESGALQVAGGASVVGNLYIGENLFTSEIKSDTNLTLDVAQGIVVLATDSSVLGSINDSGSSIPLVNTTIENTIIGGSTPASAAFTTASVSTAPTELNDITNKNYVDTQVTALSIALGI